jgi:hypothetical protein
MKKPLILQANIMSIDYCVPIPLPVWKDRCCGPTHDRTYQYLIKHILPGVDARKLEFNNHFGANIYFVAENDMAKDAFVKVIHDCLTMPKKLLPKGY